MNAYRVVSTIWHSKDKKYYEPGEIVDLSYLDGMSINVLLNSGAIEVSKMTSEEKKKKELPEPVQEVNNG